MKKNKLSKRAVLSFWGSLILCSIITSMTIMNRSNIDRLQMEQQILEKTLRINEVISRLLFKTNSLATMVIQGYGTVDNFDVVAPTIIDDPAILNVLVAPDGVVSNVYPPEASAVLGWDFFAEGIAGNLEAVAARDSGRLVLGGPFVVAQGNLALVGRLPVFIDTETEKHSFWGLVSVTLKFPEVLAGTELDLLEARGFAYELWRMNPDTNEKQVIASYYDSTLPNTRYIEKHVPVINADWYLKVWPIRMWYSYPENIALIIASILISFLVLFIMQNNTELKKVKVVLEDMARLDPLTGIYNRRHFMEISYMNIEKARRQNKTDNYIILFDIDRFKSVNDNYGHLIGDKVLIDLASRIKTLIRPYDLFARYGGEEFIIFVSEIDKINLAEMGERLRLCICNKNFEYEKLILTISASFGIARVEDYDIEKALLYADKSLYTAKSNGRNQVVIFTS